MAPRNLLTRCMILFACQALIVPGAVPLALAAPPSKAGPALLVAAHRELDAGHFARAAELFLDLYKADKTQLPLLYNAARANHLASNLDKAEELYREYIALPNADPAVIAKITPHLADIANRRAEAKAETAGKAEAAGNFALAAQLWADAVAMRPAKTAWLLRHARCLHLAGDKAAALQAYDKYLALAEATAPGSVDVARWRAELAPKTFDEVPVPKDAPPTVVVAPGELPSRLIAYAFLGTGVAVGLGGLALYMATQNDLEGYDAKVAKPGSGKVVAWSLAEANAERDSLNQRIYTSWVLGGTGVVAAGVGVWLAFRSPQGKVTVAPVRDGLLVMVRF